MKAEEQPMATFDSARGEKFRKYSAALPLYMCVTHCESQPAQAWLDDL
jgi:hypothetical protein